MTSRLLRRIAVVGASLVVTMGGFTLSATTAQAKDASKDAAISAAHPTAKVKCVNKKTGLARYSRNGTCRRTEVRQVKPCAKGGACVIGDVGPGKGRVFYVAPTKQPWGRYLEAAPASWHSGGDQNIVWCSDVVNPIAGTEPSGIGAGKANTAAMLTTCSSGAANIVSAYRGGGKSDWYLPAIDELRQLFLHKAAVGTSGFQLHGYWSSSQVDAMNAMIQDFYSDYEPAPCDKQLANFTRPIRQF